MCLYPKLIRNRKYTSNKKNGGNPPPIYDKRTEFVPIGCQNCIECRKQKARSWQVRLLEDIKLNKNGKFITFTFSNESICKIIKEQELHELSGYDLDNTIATKAIRLFLERWRKKYKKSLRHWLVTEIGHKGTENIHLHGIIWTNLDYKEIGNLWQYGYIWPRPDSKVKTWVNDQTINYMIKYVHKIDEKHPNYKSIILTSPGIGSNYMKMPDWKKNLYNGINTKETYKTRTGHEIAMPTYWRNKIYTEEEREKLWLQKLDKNERWICGEKIAADNAEGYMRLLQWHRIRNKQLGYGDDEKNWDQEQYEQQQRNLMYEKRMAQIRKEWNDEIQ